jgi:imidazolonepropionase-like amidohydrolase
MQSGPTPTALLSTILLAAYFVCSALAIHAEGGEPPYFAITNARIFTVSGAVIENGTVVVAKGLIQAVGADSKIPAEAWIIDGKGLSVYPGLIDAGTDLGLPKSDESHGGAHSNVDRAHPAMGPEDRPYSTPWRIAADELKPDDKRIADWRNAGFTSTLALPSGGIFPGQGSLIDLGDERAGEMVVRSHDAVPLSFQTSGSFYGYPDSLMGALAYMRQVLDDTRWYTASEATYEAHRNGIARIPYDHTEHFLDKSLERQEIFLIPANNQVQIVRALLLAKEWNVPAAVWGGQQGYAVASAIAAAKVPVLVSLKWPAKGKDPDPEQEQPLRDLRFRDRAPGTPAEFVKAGVKFAFYSDGLEAPKDIRKNLKRAMDAGLSADAALRAFTLDAAQILGAGDVMGSIEPGKIANLVITDGDLFGEKTKIKHVFVDGRWYPVHEETPPDKPVEPKPARAAIDDVAASNSSNAAASRAAQARVAQ